VDGQPHPLLKLGDRRRPQFFDHQGLGIQARAPSSPEGAPEVAYLAGGHREEHAPDALHWHRFAVEQKSLNGTLVRVGDRCIHQHVQDVVRLIAAGAEMDGVQTTLVHVAGKAATQRSFRKRTELVR